MTIVNLPDGWEHFSQSQQLLAIYNVSADSSERLSSKIAAFSSLVRDCSEKMRSLENENALLRDEIEQIKELLVNSPSNAELIVTGIPCSSTVPLKDIACAILKYLKLDSICSDILEVRKFMPKKDNSSTTNKTRSPLYLSRTTFSFIIRFKSIGARDLAVKIKREYGDFDFCDVFPGDLKTRVNTYEMLPTAIYKLRTLAKERAAR